jgi:putative transposase
LKRHGVAPAPDREHTTSWAAFIQAHLAVLAATDFFTAEVLTLRRLVTYYVLIFIHLESRKVDIAGITGQPDERWMQQMARNATMEGCGSLCDCRYLLHDRDTKYTHSFQAIIESGHVKTLVLPARSRNLNAYAERWMRSARDECLSKLILLGEHSLRRARVTLIGTLTDPRPLQRERADNGLGDPASLLSFLLSLRLRKIRSRY